MAKEWMGSTTCDFCRKPCGQFLFDARTKHGPWATMCTDDWFKNRVSTALGTGKGQCYELQPDKVTYLKIEG